MAEQIKAVLKALNEIPVLKIVDDERVHNKFVSLYEAIHGSDRGEMIYSLEKFHFNKLLQENKGLQECTPASIYGAFLDVSVQRLSVDPSRKLAYLYPQSVNVGTKEVKKYEKRCVLAISPYGELFLRQDYGQIRHADNPCLIYEGDKYKIITGKDGRIIEHEAVYPRKSTKIIACYVRIVKADGSIDFSILDEAAMLRLKGFSERKNFGKANALYNSGPGEQPDAGFWEAKTIKHAFDSYPKVSLKGQHTKTEADIEKEEGQKQGQPIDYSLDDSTQQENPPAEKPEKKEAGETIAYEEVKKEPSDAAKKVAVDLASNDVNEDIFN